MILYVTEAPNDRDLARLLESSAIVVPLRFGDVSFFGIGDDGEPLRVCVERKKIPDMAACVLTNRYLYQAQSAKDSGFDVLCLVIEGRYRCSPLDGLLEIPGWDRDRNRWGWVPVTPAISFSRLDQYLTEIDYLAGVIVKYTESVRGTVDVIKSLWSNFQTPPGDHQSLKAIYKQPHPTVLLQKPSLVRRIASELKGVGWDKSIAVADHFKTVSDMINADEDEWRQIPGIGKKIVHSIINEIRGT